MPYNLAGPFLLRVVSKGHRYAKVHHEPAVSSSLCRSTLCVLIPYLLLLPVLFCVLLRSWLNVSVSSVEYLHLHTCLWFFCNHSAASLTPRLDSGHLAVFSFYLLPPMILLQMVVLSRRQKCPASSTCQTLIHPLGSSSNTTRNQWPVSPSPSLNWAPCFPLVRNTMHGCI